MMISALRRLVLVLLVGMLWWAPLQAATLAGKTTVDGEAVAGIEVLAYPADTLDFSAPAPHRFGPTGADGQFVLELPRDRYYLLARGEGLFTFYGRNPVSVPKDGLENVNLLMVPTDLASPKSPARIETGVLGTVSVHGEPVSGAVVTVYPDLSSQLKGMGLGMSAPTDAEGFFEVPLPAGSYYLVVRVRKSGGFAGPLRAGDLFGYLPANPLNLAEGEVARVHIPLIEVPEKVERHAASLFGNTRITGRIVDSEGQPVAGVQAMLYDDPTMLNRPLYVSQETGPDGRFVLSFPRGGIYYLAARDELGGTPAPGELYGRYQGSPDHSVRLRTGRTLEDVQIVVEEVY